MSQMRVFWTVLAVVMLAAIAYFAVVMPDEMRLGELTASATPYVTHRDPETGRIPPLEVILKREMGANWEKYPHPLIKAAYHRLNKRGGALPLEEGQILLIPHPFPKK